MAVANYFSPFVFTETLLPLLQKTAEEDKSDVRIVNVCPYSLSPAAQNLILFLDPV